MKMFKYLAACLVGTVVFSCSSTRITSSWKEANAVTKPYHNVMVWCFLPEKDSSLRNQVETHFVNDLTDKGYHAVSSVQVYLAKAYKKLAAQEIVDEFKTTGVDAVITLVLLKKEKEESYYQPGVLNQPVNNYDHFDKYYSTVYERVLTPGYYITTTNYFWESNLFEVNADKLVYSARTKSFDPATTETLAHENGVLIIKDMLKKKVILDQMPPED